METPRIGGACGMDTGDSHDISLLLSQSAVREILFALAKGEATVTAIAAQLELDDSTISRYLKRLRDHHLVSYRIEHRWHYYRLTDRVRLRRSEHDESIEVTSATGGRLIITQRRGSS